MLTYAILLVPGSTRVPEPVRRAYLTDYASADLEPEYSQLYADVHRQRPGKEEPCPASKMATP